MIVEIIKKEVKKKNLIFSNGFAFGTYKSDNKEETILFQINSTCEHMIFYTTEYEDVQFKNIKDIKYYEDCFPMLEDLKILGTNWTHEIQTTHNVKFIEK